METNKNHEDSASRRRSRRWFLSWVAGLMTFLALALCFGAILLMRRGMRPLGAQIVGSSMEPHLVGPRLLFPNSSSQLMSSYTLDSLRPNRPLVCQYTSELDNSFDLLTAMGTPEMVEEGESVRYYLWKRMAALRAAKNKNRPNADGQDSFRGIQRGDLVVIQTPEEESREVKRIVGFPGESIDIIHGDLWVNERRWKRDLKQILEHAVLLDYGDTRSSSYWNFGGWVISNSAQKASAADHTSSQIAGSMEFRLRSGGQITNDLRWNAHDSHTLVPVSDIGFAIELENIQSDWQMAVTICARDPVTIMVERSGQSIVVSTAQNEVTKSISPDWQSQWLLFMTIDGETIVADQTSEWLRESNSESQSSEDEASFELDNAPFSIACHQGEIDVKQWAVFRDLHYRGMGDSPTQRLQSNDGIVVLGDNVSISNDSRQRWESGLSIDSIRGVVELSEQGWDSLMRQTNRYLFERNQSRFRDLQEGNKKSGPFGSSPPKAIERLPDGPQHALSLLWRRTAIRLHD